MTPRDSSIIFAHAHLHAAHGETAWSSIYFLLGSLTSGKIRREELNKYQQLVNNLKNRIREEIDREIKYHDQRQYAKAIEVYDHVIAEYPNSSLAYYEKGLSYMMTNKAAPNLKQKALQKYAECRRRDPFHWKAYQGGDQKTPSHGDFLYFHYTYNYYHGTIQC